MSKQQHETKPTIRKKVLTIMKNKVNDLFAYFLFLIMSFGFITISCSTMNSVALSLDAAVYLNVAKNLLNGKVLYSGIVDNKGPILYFMNALFLKLGGQTGIAVLEFIIIFIILLFIYKTVKLLDKNTFHQLFITIIMGTYLLRFFNYGLACEEYALAFSMIGLYECVKYYKNDKFSIYQCYSLGILGGLCFFIRQNLIVVFAGFGIGIFIKHIIEKRYKELIKYIIFSILGFITVALPILGYLLINDCFNDYIYYTFTLNMHANKQGIIKSLMDIARSIPLTILLSIIYSAVLTRNLIKNKQMENISILLIIILTILFNSIGLMVSVHYYISFVPMFLFLIIYLSNIDFKNKYTKILKVLIYLLLFSIAGFNMFFSTKDFKLTQVDQFIMDIVVENSKENDEIAIIGFMDQIYYLTGRNPVSKHTYVLSNGVFDKEEQTTILKEYYSDIMTKKPKLILEFYFTMLAIVYPYMDLTDYYEFVDENYEVIYNNAYDGNVISEDNNTFIDVNLLGVIIYKLKDSK